jgi:natural product precursor
MINLEKMGFSSEEVLQRSQMKMIVGGTMWVCTCGNEPAFLYMSDEDPTSICHDVYNTGGHCKEV